MNKNKQCMWVGFLSAISGSSLLFTYLKGIEAGLSFYLLITAVILLTACVIIAYEGTKQRREIIPLFLIITFIMMFSLNAMSFFRFRFFSGGSVDALWEYFVAKKTADRHYWDYTTVTGRWMDHYFSCLSITIIPVIISQVSGLGLFTVFGLIFPIVFAVTPILVFLAVKEAFGKMELAALSTILYVEFYHFSALQHVRQWMAQLFLTLIIFLILKNKDHIARRSQVLLLLIFVFGVVTSHYGTIFILNTILLFIAIGWYVLSRSSTVFINKILRFDSRKMLTRSLMLNKNVFAFVLVISFTWLVFVNIRGFIANILTLQRAILASLGLMEPEWLSGFDVPGTKAGDVVSTWYTFQLILSVVGFLYVTLRERKDPRLFAWVFGGFAIFGSLFIFTVTPTLSAALSFNRVCSIGLPFISSFLAYVLLRVNKRFSGFMIIFLSLNLAINMSIPSYNHYVLYYPEKQVPPQYALPTFHTRVPDFFMSQWINDHLLPNQRVLVDARSSLSFFHVENIIPRVIPHPNFVYDSKYLALNYFNLKYGLWWSRGGSYPIEVQGLKKLINNANIIYNSAESMSLMNLP